MPGVIWASARHHFVGNLQCFVDDGKAFRQLVIGDAQGRVAHETAPPAEGEESIFSKVLIELTHGRV